MTGLPDRPQQVPDMAYSPPCFAFTGDNGGATIPGRHRRHDPGRLPPHGRPEPAQDCSADLGGVQLDESNEEMARTAEGLVEYFNQNFQFYGRKIELVLYDGRGRCCQEFLGAGQDAASNDAIKVANEIGAFADVTGAHPALRRRPGPQRGRRRSGRPTCPASGSTPRRPYAWSNVPDCTVDRPSASAEYANKRLLGRDAHVRRRRPAGQAPHDGGHRPRQPRVPAVRRRVRGGHLAGQGNQVALRLDYTLDVATLRTQAANLIAKLKAEGITSVSCGCDPILPVYLAQEATAQDYYPEWLIAGAGFTDLDLGGQIIANNAADQWNQAFGGSRVGRAQSPETSDAYAAYRSVRTDEPSVLVDLIYYQMLIAGPRHPDGRARPHARDVRDRAVRLPAEAPARRDCGTSAPATTRRSTTSARSGGTPTHLAVQRQAGHVGRQRHPLRPTARSPRATRRCSREAAAPIALVGGVVVALPSATVAP